MALMVLGGGQLARMLAIEAAKLDLKSFHAAVWKEPYSRPKMRESWSPCIVEVISEGWSPKWQQRPR